MDLDSKIRNANVTLKSKEYTKRKDNLLIYNGEVLPKTRKIRPSTAKQTPTGLKKTKSKSPGLKKTTESSARQ
jgi:hypothetical protein